MAVTSDSPHHPPDPNLTRTDPKVAGAWELLEAEFECAATHVALLPTHQVFAYGGSSLDVEAFAQPPPAELLDLQTWRTRKLSMDGVEGDPWCGGHTLLEDGRLLFLGGTSYYPQAPDPLFGGLKEAYIYDPFSELWERLPDMRSGRWYPTLIRLPDNTVFVISGLEYRSAESETEQKGTLRVLFELVTRINDRIVNQHEVFTSGNTQWGLMEAQWAFPLYPRLHLLPDGDVFYSGVFNTHYFVPGRFPSARWDHTTRTWSEVGGRHVNKNREEGISVLMPLRPPDYQPEILIAGGGHHNLGRILVSLFHSIGQDRWGHLLNIFLRVQDSVEMINLADPEPRWRMVGRTQIPRLHANGVLLPDGNLALVGGMSRYGNQPGTHMPSHPVLQTELYDAAANTWTLAAAQERPRVYHSTAILLPDARVISMGGNPEAKMIEHGIEVYSPPYLFRGDRPAITQAPEQIAHGVAFDVEVDKARQVGQVVLMRPEVLTHVTNTDQRLLELEFRLLGDTKLEATGPPTNSHMPQGYCLLFVLNMDGVPSVGRFVQVG